MELLYLSRSTTKRTETTERTETTQQAQVGGKRIGVLDAHSFIGDHNMAGNEGYIAGRGQWNANDSDLLDAHKFAGGLSEDLYRQIVTAACDAATLAAMRAVQIQISSGSHISPPDHPSSDQNVADIRSGGHAQNPSSSRGAPLDQPSSDGNESRTNNLEPFRRMYPSIPTRAVWSCHFTLQVPVPRRECPVLTRTNLWMYVGHLVV